jgi:hypothetical protein
MLGRLLQKLSRRHGNAGKEAAPCVNPPADLVDLDSLGVFVGVDGYSPPDWQRIQEAISALPADTPFALVWRSVVAQWLDRLAGELGNAYVYRSSRSMLVTSASEDDARRLSRFIDRTCEQIALTLGDLALDHADWPVVVIDFDSHEKYYTYVSHFYSDGEYATSGGVCIRQGYVHAVFPPVHYARSEAIAHELTHLLLAERDMPLWFEEGVCQVMEEIAIGARHFNFDREMSRRQREHWGPRGLQAFWSGEAFSLPDDHQELSYALAQAIVRVMIGDHPKGFRGFIREAHWSDSGDGAARKHFGANLAEFVAPMLGEGEWAPKPIEEAPGKPSSRLTLAALVGTRCSRPTYAR